MPEHPLGVTQNPRFNLRLSKMETPADIPERWHNTPIAALIGAHNFDIPIQPAGNPELLIAACIEFRFSPRVPSMYAYVIRRASGRLLGSEFPMLYTLSRGVKHVVMIAHDDCGMTKVSEQKPAMIQTLIDQGWNKDRAEDFVAMHAGKYAIEDEVDALKSEFFRLRTLFKKIEIAPLFVSLSSHKLYLPNWYLEFLASPAMESSDESAQVAAEDLLMM
ncbi:MAG: hypothetical protein KGS72_27690 [Cyanobacteria bacterium REEB67]|nr:hypothetical protein [Cyanobacteria bacterium REEB67]